MDNNPVMHGITWFATHFIGLFNASATAFTNLLTGILPLLMVMLTFMYALTTWIGEQRVTRAIQWASRWALTRYTIMPFLAMLLLTNPMAYTFGRFLPERYKPAFYDSAVSFCHPITSLFPHANAGEIFVWSGVSAGVTHIAPGKYATLAALYFLVGLVVILIRGVATQWLTAILIKRGGHEETFRRYDEAYQAGRIQGVTE